MTGKIAGKWVFVPPMVSEWFNEMVKTRKKLMDQLSNEDLEGAFEPTIYNLILSVLSFIGSTTFALNKDLNLREENPLTLTKVTYSLGHKNT